MRKIILKFIWLGFMALASTSACNMPSTEKTSPQLATAAALTVQAVLNNASNATTPPTNPSITSTPTFSQPMASVGEVTNCRTGPGTNYERVIQIFPKEMVNIIGFYSPNYWIVSTKNGDCWLSGEFATPVGSFATVPTVTAPPTAEGSAPEAATFLKQNGWTFYCYYPEQADITLSWNDNANNETGYRVLRNNEIIAELPADSTFFGETIKLTSGQSVEYQIRAYNTTNQTDSAIVTITCP